LPSRNSLKESTLDMEKKKLCLVIPSLQAGGMERVMSELAVYFSSHNGVEVHMILYGITREIFYSIPETVIVHRPVFSFNNKRRFFSTIKTMAFLRREIKGIKPHSILSFGEYWNSFVLLALTGLKFSVFVSDRCQPDKSLGKMHDTLRKLLYPRAAGIIVQTEKAREIYSRQIKHANIAVIGNPIKSVDTGKKIRKENIVLMVGRFIKTKHQDKLTELFLRISNPDWKLVLVGYDHLKQKLSEKLRKIIAGAHAEESVIIAGKQADVETYYLKSKIFAFTSSSEGFPNVIGEAMSAGLPVVAFDCIAGPSEMIENNKSGFLIPLFDYQQFQEKLQLLMENDEMRDSFGRRGSEIIEQFSLDRIGEKYSRFILRE